MAGSMKDIKLRIKSVESTMQITKAMELVASSKMRRAKERVEHSRPYFETLHDTLTGIAAADPRARSPYLRRAEIKRTLLVVIAGDRGLAGGYNSNVLKQAEAQQGPVTVLPIGKRSQEYFAHHGADLFTEEVLLAADVSVGECFALSRKITEGYLKGDYDAVKLCYTRFDSMMTQTAVTMEVLPLTMTMDGEEYPNTLDGRYITNEEFYKRLRAGKTSTTAAANVGQFEDAMRAVLGRGQDILCLCFSSALSTTYQSAVIAAENVAPDFPERTIRVIDTLSASRGQGLLVYLAAQKKKEGLTLSQLGDWVEDNKLHVCHWFTVDDLNFLKRGGRVSAAAALFGTMLSIKPVLHVDDTGHLVPVSKTRGRKASLLALVDRMAESAVDPAGQTIFISHGDCEADAEFVADEVRRRFGVQDIYINYVGPVIGNHSGPGTLALFFLGSRR